MIKPVVQKIFNESKKTKPFKGFIVDLIEYPTLVDGTIGYIGLRVYKDNVERFSEPQKLSLAEWLFNLERQIRDTGERCFIEGATNDPRKFSVVTR